MGGSVPEICSLESSSANDDALVAASVALALRDAGFAVTETTTVQECLEGWLSTIQAELMRSGHTLTVKARDSLVVFIVRASRGA
jgi:hypothetical protein